MLIEPQGIKHLDSHQRQQLRRDPKLSRRPNRHRARVALATTLTAWAKRLAPELSPPPKARQVVTDC